MKVAVIMGSKSDFNKLEDGIDLLKNFGVDVKVRILSAHRTPKELTEFLESIENDTDVIIAAAGKAAHLPGVIAAQTLIPVVGLPIKASMLDGMDALFSIVQMPKGIPVATVAIDSSVNAALMAIHIMGIKYEGLRSKLKDYRLEMAKKVLDDDKSIN